jgi:hypothetical protein
MDACQSYVLMNSAKHLLERTALEFNTTGPVISRNTGTLESSSSCIAISNCILAYPCPHGFGHYQGPGLNRSLACKRVQHRTRTYVGLKGVQVQILAMKKATQTAKATTALSGAGVSVCRLRLRGPLSLRQRQHRNSLLSIEYVAGFCCRSQGK